MTARSADPTSSHERVARIEHDTDRIHGPDVRKAIERALGLAEHEYEEGCRDRPWITDSDIHSMHDATSGRSTSRNDIARHRLRIERGESAPLIRIDQPTAGSVLHFRRRLAGERPLPEEDAPNPATPMLNRLRRHERSIDDLVKFLAWIDRNDHRVVRSADGQLGASITTDRERYAIACRYHGIDPVKLNEERRTLVGEMFRG